MDILKHVETKPNSVSPHHKWKKLVAYYKPYKGLFAADMFFAFMGAAISLVMPLLVRYITDQVIYEPREEMLRHIVILAGVMLGLVLVECYSNYFIAYYGHMMGAKIEFSMRNEIFGHFQKLSFSFYDNQKVGQLMSRIGNDLFEIMCLLFNCTPNDLFEITELLHHGPEDVIISLIKLIGSLVILLWINPKLALAAFAVVPVMFVYALFFNRRMKGQLLTSVQSAKSRSGKMC